MLEIKKASIEDLDWLAANVENGSYHWESRLFKDSYPMIVKKDGENFLFVENFHIEETIRITKVNILSEEQRLAFIAFVKSFPRSMKHEEDLKVTVHFIESNVSLPELEEYYTKEGDFRYTSKNGFIGWQ